MGGPPVDNVAISMEGEKTIIRLFIPAGIVGLSLVFLCLRSVRLTAMVFVRRALCRRHQPGPRLLLGRLDECDPADDAGGGLRGALSGAIHFANYYRDSVAAKAASKGAPARAIKARLDSPAPCRPAPPRPDCSRYAPANWCPIKSFGVYSAAGVMATWWLLFTVPARRG